MATIAPHFLRLHSGLKTLSITRRSEIPAHCLGFNWDSWGAISQGSSPGELPWVPVPWLRQCPVLQQGDDEVPQRCMGGIHVQR